MQKIRASLSRLFLNKPSKSELARLHQLELLQREHQGKPFVFDEGNLRFMYFNQKSVQSAMKINAPDELLCGYTSAMMAFLLVNPAPQQILMIGLGGGSLVKFCYHHLPDCHITVLEIDPDVIALRGQFMIPANDDRLTIIHCDAIDYLAQNTLQVDILLLDGFDAEGLVQELNTASFYAACHAALKPTGILVANMWGKRALLVPLLSALRGQFGQNVWWCRSLDSYNLIVFSLKSKLSKFTPSNASQLQTGDQSLTLQLTKLNQQMRTLHVPEDADYDARERVALTADLATLLVTDDSLPRSEVEWSATHQ
ncbi:MAG: fused MFS/spermidine synthase [Undibacterium sp.]|uniref:fused MFS/spermidine synthase n=1 Tax=Undibacterium sp. TaxID=1914977 RepID=UPI002725D3B9|nr:fused MFS/spermidine synthase [Undibacterium sp.]MDO8654788.1 fused MFS/spermidine synthase [Undibacterium sp.]